MHALYDLKETLCKELKSYAQQEKLTTGALDIVDKLTHTIKNLDKIIDKYEEEEEYSNSSYGRGSYEGGSMSNASYARGRGRGAKRDSMGRYANDGSYARDYSRNYSGEYGYSRNEDMKMELQNLMDAATDEHTREMVRNIMNKM